MKACCFTGHRDLPKGEAERLTEKARALILLLIQEGFTEFRVGGTVGFDMIMAELLLRLRDEEKQEIRIISDTVSFLACEVVVGGNPAAECDSGEER